MYGELKYRIILFKIKGHTTWRMTTEGSFDTVKNVTEKKIIDIDRMTGEVTVDIPKENL